ncbi:protein white-like [Uloborus diversus]|uniref:protein white-like n=1 Tax=Uloborus diversus TaxID=327109 RepID=UPI002409D1C0|nr:protein white-like [Uloborus diversus]
MGASGAGKTTLLNTLTGRNLRRLEVNGEVLINGENVGQHMARLSAYVQQDDLFIGTLTVREHLVFQALLRMDQHLNYHERMKRVGEAILELGLTKCVDTTIGVAGTKKGISGGEAKRLAFAAEVLTNPALMFCDEPTSGLDSFMSQSIISVLRNMAGGGRTIVCTIHQPSSEVFEMFDQLLLLAEGKVAYLGKASKAVEFFNRAGLCCPVNYNPSDFFIHNLAIVPGKEEECKSKVESICSQFEKERCLRLFLPPSPVCSFIPGEITYKSKYKASWCSQFYALLWRCWISMIREPMLAKVRFVQTLVVSLLLGLIYLNQAYDQNGIMNLNGALFLALTNITFHNLFSVINTFCLEKPIFLREHWNGMYRADVYFLCKTIAEAPFIILMTAMFVSILYWLIGLNSDYKAFLTCVAVTVLIANTAASFGYMISCLTDSVNVAMSISTPLMTPLLLFGGFFLNNASVPSYFLVIKYLSWFYYGNEVLCINQWSSITNITCSDNPMAPCIRDGDTVLDTLNFKKDHFLRDIAVIVALFLFFRTLAFIALLIKSRRKT